MTGTTVAGTPGSVQGRLTSQQTEVLLRPINPLRVQNLRGLAHLEAWDVRRHLIRVFGVEGFTTQTLSLDLVSERETRSGDRSRWSVVYRAEVRLIVRDPSGKVAGYWDDAAAGDSVNQPSLGDAHDMAMKTALSQALKRCAVNLGDQFGLSLYNGGSREAVVLRSLAYEAAPVAEAEDAPVRPEPTPGTLSAVEAPTEAEAPQRDFLQEAREAPDAATARGIYTEAKEAGAAQPYLDQIADVGARKPGARQTTTAVCSPEQTEHAVAVTELCAFAAEHDIDDIVTAAETQLGMPLDDAPAHAIRGLLAQLRRTAA